MGPARTRSHTRTLRTSRIRRQKTHNNNNEHTLHSYYDLYLNLTFVWDKKKLVAFVAGAAAVAAFQAALLNSIDDVLFVVVCSFSPHFQFS